MNKVLFVVPTWEFTLKSLLGWPIGLISFVLFLCVITFHMSDKSEGLSLSNLEFGDAVFTLTGWLGPFIFLTEMKRNYKTFFGKIFAATLYFIFPLWCLIHMFRSIFFL